MKYFSTFSGIGGFEIGIQNAYRSTQRGEQADSERDKRQGLLTTQGQDPSTAQRSVSERLADMSNEGPLCVGYSEIDKYASSVYEYHNPGVKNYGDITKINAEELPDFDCLVGGFPCQAFSIAGKRRGFDDTRGTLFFDLARILRAKQPRLFVFENVKGLLSHDNGNTFKTIIATIDELGYDCQWQVLNSKNHGVPQNRERIYIVGHLRGTPRPEVFPIGQDSATATELQGQQANTLTARYYGAQGTGTYITERELYEKEIKQLNQPKHSNDRVYSTGGVSPTLNTMQGGNRQPFVTSVDYKNPASKTRRGRVKEGYVGTLETDPQVGVVDHAQIRRLTPTECERLQGFPDNWTAISTNGAVSDTQRYKMCGNAVTTNVVQAVFEKLLKPVDN